VQGNFQLLETPHRCKTNLTGSGEWMSERSASQNYLAPCPVPLHKALHKTVLCKVYHLIYRYKSTLCKMPPIPTVGANSLEVMEIEIFQDPETELEF
jgi:hypothetical protein